MQSDSRNSIGISLDLGTAQLLYDVLYAGGEHHAAGAAMPKLDTAECDALAKVMAELKAALEKAGSDRLP
jgi:hypothetical protein